MAWLSTPGPSMVRLWPVGPLLVTLKVYVPDLSFVPPETSIEKSASVTFTGVPVPPLMFEDPPPAAGVAGVELLLEEPPPQAARERVSAARAAVSRKSFICVSTGAETNRIGAGRTIVRGEHARGHGVAACIGAPASDRRGRPSVLHPRPADVVGRRVRRSHARAPWARGRRSEPRHAGLADAADRGGHGVGVRGGRAPPADALARERPKRHGVRGVVGAPRPSDRRGALPARNRAEGRRARHLARVRGRHLRPWGDAWKRGRRRGRHRQPPHRPRDPAPAGRRAGAARRRGARRGLPPARGVRTRERGADRRGREAVHEPAELGGGIAPPEEPGRDGATAAEPLGVRHRPLGGPRARDPLGLAGVASRPGLPGLARRRAPRRPRLGAPVLPRVRGASRHPELRRRRRRRQGLVARPAAPAGVGRPRPPLGDRLQVRADDGHHQAREDRPERGPHGRAQPVRDPRAGGRRRRDRVACDAPQRGRHPAQGHPGRRPRHHPAGGRRDPAGGRAGARAGRSPRARRGGCPTTARCARRRSSGPKARRATTAPTAPARRAGTRG